MNEWMMDGCWSEGKGRREERGCRMSIVEDRWGVVDFWIEGIGVEAVAICFIIWLYDL